MNEEEQAFPSTNEPFVEEAPVEIKRVENGAGDLLILEHHTQYTPGYRVTMHMNRETKYHRVVRLWLPELKDALKLFESLEKVDDSENE